jgi:hypothetical protein
MEVSTMYALPNLSTPVTEPAIIGPSWKDLYGSEGLVTTEDGETITVVKEDEYLD